MFDRVQKTAVLEDLNMHNDDKHHLKLGICRHPQIEKPQEKRVLLRCPFIFYRPFR